jgi:hypothetical protein
LGSVCGLLGSLVGNGEHRRRGRDLQLRRRLNIDDQPEPGRRLNQKIDGFGALKDTIIASSTHPTR